MLHPSYSDLLDVINKDVEPGEAKVVNSRYSVVMATAKRARQLIDGQEAFVEATENGKDKKPLSIAVEELSKGKIEVIGDED